ncbi:serine hydrolase [Solimicrobium silvestre]|uniref:D-alanyl-D-alanine carboxypeptidase n=1 Tax=Solimicrobium silvestre TaxID=2099400 RepID=A0A2S9GVZ9_9BURK|nr:serine hydrolase [Solimicrobium silvestre]PRC91894.1 D-alanyl-D-alanine carboxypeptidase [Solimicrobium silvestre]
MKLIKLSAACLLLITTSAFALPFGSQSALVIDENSGQVLLEKNADNVVPIASLTKLMTAMVVIDAKQDMEAPISIDEQDVDVIKHSTSRVPVGATLPRKDVLQLALMSSDNRAAASLARTYPGGIVAFEAAVHAKLLALGMTHTTIEEPTGLSFHNTSTASDLVKMASAASQYTDITRITTDSRDMISIKGRQVEYHNTNGFVGKKGWDIMLSKTGYTTEAGRCIIMKIKAAGKNVIMVLLNAGANSTRNRDAMNVRRFVSDEKVAVVKTRHNKQRA